ncbi:MAG: orotidine-5'-phosphate decarboxylase [Armatimonadota bacterium]
MLANFADRVAAAIREKDSRLCVGLDPRVELLPPGLEGTPARQVERFCFELCLAVAPFAVAVKPQSAYFEALGSDGVAVLERVCCFAREIGLLVVLDAKRNDIGSTAEAYAQAYLSGRCCRKHPLADAITVNGYLGSDGVKPFIELSKRQGTGLFVLVKTSNPGSGELQDLKLESGLTVYQQMADLVAQWGQDLIGEGGYSSVGAVVGATYPAQLDELRRRVPTVPFLVPGYGHQGGTAVDLSGAFDAQGLGAIVNSARAINYAFKDCNLPFAAAAAQAAQAARDDINGAIDQPGEA